MIQVNNIDELQTELLGHMWICTGGLSDDLWEIGFHEGTDIHVTDDGIELKGDNGIMTIQKDDLPQYLDINFTL